MPLIRGAPVQLSRRFFNRQQRRYASHHPPHHAEAVNESFGKGFYFTIATVPFAYFLYRATRSVEAGEEPYLTKVIRQYELWLDSWRDRNELHTKMVEQAGFDRLILQHSPPSKAVDIKFTEVFNTGSAINVWPGSRVNLDAVVEHYARQRAEVDEERRRRVERAKRRAKQAETIATDPYAPRS